MTRNSNNRSASPEDALKEAIRASATAFGFDACGFCRSQILEPERERYLEWLHAGRSGDMKWLHDEWALRASDPKSLLSSVQSVVCVALSYAAGPASVSDTASGRIARYASGQDYHNLIRERLVALCEEISRYGGTSFPFVDTAPTMDKALAVRAGLGWQGRNTNVLSQGLGSFTFLGGVLTDLEIEPDQPIHDGCGSCRLCVVACPTGALQGDYTIDARLCISYLTIELRGPIPRHLRPLMADWVFGCDICQDVCPPVTILQDRDFPNKRDGRIAYVRGLVDQSRTVDHSEPGS